jgi:hypothetical protein
MAEFLKIDGKLIALENLKLPVDVPKRPVTGVVPLRADAVDISDFPVDDATITLDFHNRSVEITHARLDVSVDGDVIKLRFSGWINEDDVASLELI